MSRSTYNIENLQIMLISYNIIHTMLFLSHFSCMCAKMNVPLHGFQENEKK